MADLKQMMLDEIRKSSHIKTSSVNETEILIDTGMPKNDENIISAALTYLDEKGYRRRVDNLERAKQMIIESSEGYDTVIVRKKNVVEQDLFEKAGITELRDAMSVCMLETLTSMNSNMKRMADPMYEYKVEVVNSILLESDRPRGHLSGDFESFEELLNRYASRGWQTDKIYSEPRLNNGQRTVVVFRREKLV